MHVCVIGLGYIGLPTSAIIAARGMHVTGVDINPNVVESVNNGEVHIVEPGLPELVKGVVNSGHLKATTAPVNADVYLIIVPTPFIEEDKRPDMRFVEQAATTLAPLLEEGNLIILESTSSVGATRAHVLAPILAARPELEGKIHVAFCPERAIPGDTLRELVDNDRTVGGVDKASAQAAAAFYKRYVHGDVIETDADTAELVKLVENASRDVSIAFANELSRVCDTLDLNVWEVIRLANQHPRVNIMQPGPGVGGHCIAVDPWFIVDAAPDDARLMRTAREVNDSKPAWVIGKIKAAVAQMDTPTVGLLGLAFKPNVDDLRESPSLKIARSLLSEQLDATIIACEPYVDVIDGIPLENLEDTLSKADILVMLTDHDVFKEITPERLAGKTLIDTRGTFDGR